MKLNKLLLLNIISLSLVSCDGNVSLSNNISTSENQSSSIEESSTVVETLSKDLTIGEKSNVVGKKINDIQVSASSIMYNADNLVNDTGMSGSESYLHTHTNLNSRNTMFLTQANQKDNYVLLTLANSISLGHLYIWNLNDKNKLDCGVKEFEITYSLDGINFFKLHDETYTLSKANANEKESHSLINNNDYFDFEGVNAKYIKINFISNYGGIYYGLSEIRLYQYKQEIKENALLIPTLYKGAKETCKLYDSSGMSDTFSSNATCSNNINHMYSSTRKEFTLDLNGMYPVNNISIWNYNDKDNLEYGIKDIEIHTSYDGVSFTKVKEASINKATGNSNMQASNTISLDNTSTQFIKFVIKSNYGGSRNGLSEIRIYAGKGLVSEPHMEYTGMLSNYSGWTGADGIFASNLDGNQSIGHKNKLMFNFSDTYVGEVDAITKDRKNTTMRNHTFATLSDNVLNFYTDESTIIKAEKDLNRSASDCYYWLGDSTVIDDKYYVSAHYIAKEGVLGFTQRGEDLVKFDIVNDAVDLNSKVVIKDINTNKLSYFSTDGKLDIIFGSAFFENTDNCNVTSPDGYIYNYGYMDDRNKGSRSLVVCRTLKENIENFDTYQYLSNEGWVNDITKVKPLIDHVACEMSVVQINNPNSEYYGKYMLTYQYENNRGKQLAHR